MVLRWVIPFINEISVSFTLNEIVEMLQILKNCILLFPSLSIAPHNHWFFYRPPATILHFYTYCSLGNIALLGPDSDGMRLLTNRWGRKEGEGGGGWMLDQSLTLQGEKNQPANNNRICSATVERRWENEQEKVKNAETDRRWGP